MKTAFTLAILAATACFSPADAALRGRARKLSCSWYDPTCGHGLFTKKNAVGRAATDLGESVVAVANCGAHIDSCIEGCFAPEHRETLHDAVNQAKAIDAQVHLMQTEEIATARYEMQMAGDALAAYTNQAGGAGAQTQGHKHHHGNHRVLKNLSCKGVTANPTAHSVGSSRVDKAACFATCEEREDCAYATLTSWYTTSFCHMYNVALQCEPVKNPLPTTGGGRADEYTYVKDHKAMLERLTRDSTLKTTAFHGYATQLRGLHQKAQDAHAAVQRARAIVSNVENNRCHKMVKSFEDLENSAKALVDAVEKWVKDHECTLIDMGIDLAAMAFDGWYKINILPMTLPYMEPFCQYINKGAMATKGGSTALYDAAKEVGDKVVEGVVSVFGLPQSYANFADEVIQDFGEAMLLFSCGDGAEGAWAMLRPVVMCNIHVSGENCGDRKSVV